MRFFKFVFSRFFICITVIAALLAAIIFLCFYIHSLLSVAAAIALACILSVTAAVCLLVSESPSDFKYGWLTLIAVLPVAGAVLYFISYLSRTQKSDRSPILPPSDCLSYEYFADGAAYLNRLITLISAAKKRVLLEYYIVSKGDIWGALCRELKNALARGVQVLIIYDGLGSALRAPKRDFKALKKAGAQIKVFNKLLPLPVSRLNFRDHRKIAAIDGEAVFLGGVNIADEYANLCSPHGYWKDGGAVFFGNIAKTYEQIFTTAFNGESVNDRDEKARYPHNILKLTDFSETEDENHTAGKLPLLPVADEPERKGSVCEDLLAGAICSAKQRVYIFTPYLCTGDKLGDALSFAARRGVDVKLIIPHIPDKRLTYAITRSYCERLAESGVQIYEYTPGFMHFKCVVCDCGTLLGSYNFDFRSMRLNYECGVWGGGELTEDAVRDFENCLALCSAFKCGKKHALAKLARALLTLLAPLV